MLHRVDELLGAEHVDVQMMRALHEVAVHHLHEVLGALLVAVPQRAGVDRLRIGNAVQRPVIRQLGGGIEGGQQAVLLRAVARVRAR